MSTQHKARLLELLHDNVLRELRAPYIVQPFRARARWIGQGPSSSSCEVMRTRVPVVVGPNCPLRCSTMMYGAAHPRTCA